jgi:hypothetical protein
MSGAIKDMLKLAARNHCWSWLVAAQSASFPLSFTLKTQYSPGISNNQIILIPSMS